MPQKELSWGRFRALADVARVELQLLPHECRGYRAVPALPPLPSVGFGLTHPAQAAVELALPAAAQPGH